MSGWAVGLAGSYGLYHAKLDWIKVWTRWLCNVLMKGIFSTFGSMKSPLLNHTGNKMRSCFFIPFQGTGFTRHCGGTAAELKQKREDRRQPKGFLSANLVSNGRLRLGNDSFAFE